MMMKRTYSYLIAFLLTFVFTAAASQLMAQSSGPPPPPQSNNSSSGSGAAPVPIDGGLGILLAAGAALGGKKLYDRNKKKGEPNA